MLGADVVMLETLRLFLGELHDRAGPFGEAIEVPTLLRACFGSLPAGATPALTAQPSADRANDPFHSHLLILSVSLLLLTRRASSGSLWPLRLSHRRAQCVHRGTVRPIVCAGVPGCAAPGRANRCRQARGPTSAPSRYLRGRRGNALASASSRRLPSKAPGPAVLHRAAAGASTTQYSPPPPTALPL